MIVLPSSAGIYRPFAGSTAWTPSSLPLLAWYKADAGVLDASDNPITADSTAVKTWQDQSGNGRHLVQNTSASRPVFRTVANSFSSLPALEASGSQFLENTALDLSGGLSLYVVCKFVGTPTLYTGVFQFGGGNAHMIFNDITDTQYFRIGNVSDTPSGAAITGTRQVLKAVVNGATWKFKQSADGQSSKTHTSTINPGTGYKLFQNYVGTATCQISEYILCSRELTSGEEASLNDYLKTRYAVDTNAIYYTLPVSGAALWLDGSRLDTLYTTDTGSTNVSTNAGAIGRWEDLSGNARHAKQATAGSRPTWVSPFYGRLGLGAVAFNGSQWIDLDNTSSYNLGSSNFTIEGWFKLTTTTQPSTFIAKDLNGNRSWILFYESNSTVNFVMFSGINGSGAKTLANSYTLGANTWFHIAVVRSGNTVSMYINGVLQANTVDVTGFSAAANTSAIRLGMHYASTNGYNMKGQIQNAIIWPQALYTSNFTPFMSS